MKALVINSGSSSIKISLYKDGELISHQLYEEIKDHSLALSRILASISIKSLDFVAHRVVHGGELFIKPTRIDQNSLKALKSLHFLAPLHNPYNVLAIEYFLKEHPAIPQVAVFDTAFHTTMPKESYTYAIKPEFLTRSHIRRYGFHGSSHSYLLKESAKRLGKKVEKTSIISLHLGNGASACAIKNGKSIDTSMGFTPLEGLVMGSRCGDIDAGVVLYMQRELGFSVDEVDRILNKESGLEGLCGTNDMRTIIQREDEEAKTALSIYARRIKKYIGAYMVLLEDVDAVVFSGGVGEHATKLRQMVLEGMEKVGILPDFEANSKNESIISKKESHVQVFVIPTDEEREIFESAREVVADE